MIYPHVLNNPRPAIHSPWLMNVAARTAYPNSDLGETLSSNSR